MGERERERNGGSLLSVGRSALAFPWSHVCPATWQRAPAASSSLSCSSSLGFGTGSGLALALAQVWLPLCGLRVLKIVKHSTGKLSTDLWPAMELALALVLLLKLLLLSMLSVLQSSLIFGRLSAPNWAAHRCLGLAKKRAQKRLNLADTTNYCEKNQLYGSFGSVSESVARPKKNRVGLIDGPASAPLATCHLLLPKLANLASRQQFVLFNCA